MSEETLQAKIDELEIALEAKQERIKELDGQIMDLQYQFKYILDLNVRKRWQFRAIKRAYEKWIYSRHAQQAQQLKLEITRLEYKNKELNKLLDESNEIFNELVENIQKVLDKHEQPEVKDDVNN